MGKHKFKGNRTQRKDFGNGKRDNTWTDYRQRNVNWANINEKKQLDGSLNDGFQEYYKEQGICPESEWGEFMDVLSKPLPIVFRINGSGKFADALRKRLEQDFFSKLGGLIIDGEEVVPPYAMPWYPNKLAWHMNFSRTQLRKMHVLQALHEFIKREHGVGSISRQEAVSMVPPLFLDVQPHHTVLDMCAAPGSKTFQMLEMIHSGNAPATGLVVANDADSKRCNLLAHQTKRMCSPSMLVCNHEGQSFPLVRPGTAAKVAVHGALMYDRILCDVPCTGDGTLRKAPDIWRRWKVGQGNGLHALQLRITLQACRLLKVGGRMVYSTCSFNPVENEAVVAAVLKATKGAIQLVDVSETLPALKRKHGLLSWKVKDNTGWYSAWSEALPAAEAGKCKLQSTMFPPLGDSNNATASAADGAAAVAAPEPEAKDAAASEEEKANYEETKKEVATGPPAPTHSHPLDRCMRFLPHHQDTGGFFVAVLEKVRDCSDLVVPQNVQKSAKNKDKQKNKETAKDAAANGGAKRQRTHEEVKAEATEEPFVKKEKPSAAEEPPVKRTKPSDVKSEPESESKPDVKSEPETDKEPAKESEAKETTEESTELKWDIRGGGGRGRGKTNQGKKRGDLDPVVPVTDDAILGPVKDFYGLGTEFPLNTHLVTRCLDAADRPKKCYYVSDAVRKILMMDETESMKVIAIGLKLLERQEVRDGSNPCIYRISQEGLPFLLPHITKQRIHLPLDLFLALITKRVLRIPKSVPYTTVRPPKVKELSETADKPPEEVNTTRPDGGFAATTDGDPPREIECPDAIKELSEVCAGCCVVLLRPEDAKKLGLPTEQVSKGGCLSAEAPVAISCWRTKNTINILVSKEDCAVLADRLTQLQGTSPEKSTEVENDVEIVE